LTEETVSEYETWLKKRFKNNSLSVKAPAVNLYLEFKGVGFKMRRPAKEYAANPRLVKPGEYEALIGRIQDPAERLCIRILHDSLLRPSDVVRLRVADLAIIEGVTAVRLRTQKTGRVSNSYLTAETAAELRAYIQAKGVTEHIFTVDGVRARHRTWPNTILQRQGAEGITPRTFRRTGATYWTEDIASLMAQGAWTDPKTIFAHYRRDVHDRHLEAFNKTMERTQEQKPPPNSPMENSPSIDQSLPPTWENRNRRNPEVL
jgi:integrase